MNPVVCIGAAVIDDTFRCENEPLRAASNPATHSRSAGGVARNVAHHLAQLGNPVELVAHFGSDPEGEWLKEQCLSAGVGAAHSHTSHTRTGHFVGIISPSGELYTGAADTHFEEAITVPLLAERESLFKSAALMLLDCNLSIPCIEWLLDFCRTNNLPCVVEPVSATKASRLRGVDLRRVTLITPNTAELAVICGSSKAGVEALLKRGVLSVWLRKGADGSQLYSEDAMITLPAPRINIADTTGAGDAALAGWIHAWLRSKNQKECLMYGHAMAQLILQTTGAHSDRLTSAILEETINMMGSQ